VYLINHFLEWYDELLCTDLGETLENLQWIGKIGPTCKTSKYPTSWQFHLYHLDIFLNYSFFKDVTHEYSMKY